MTDGRFVTKCVALNWSMSFSIVRMAPFAVASASAFLRLSAMTSRPKTPLALISSTISRARSDAKAGYSPSFFLNSLPLIRPCHLKARA